MADILARICADKRRHIAERRQLINEIALQEQIRQQVPCRGFLQALRSKADARQNALIAEVKKASPSKGIIRADFDPVIIAKAYERAGAACLSVLTDIPYFQGNDDYLIQARQAVALPVLRKDFMLDTYQVLEARAMGADCILLIMAALEDAEAAALEAEAFELGMDVLIEVHDQAELERALRLRSRLIGINNRNLKTLEISLTISETLSKQVPQGYTLVCESGIKNHEDIVRMNRCGMHSFLVGESLMRQGDIESAVKRLLVG